MSLTRSYDASLSPIVLAAARERRAHPDGLLRRPSVTWRGGVEVMRYPWHQLRLGDFFFVPLFGRDPKPLSIRFRQYAAKRDWELTCLTVNAPDGTPSLRVCLTMMDVSKVTTLSSNHAAITVATDRAAQRGVKA